jgi:hypothetical protein
MSAGGTKAGGSNPVDTPISSVPIDHRLGMAWEGALGQALAQWPGLLQQKQFPDGVAVEQRAIPELKPWKPSS